jgi:hypothetical protein
MGVVAPAIYLLSFPEQGTRIEHRMDGKDTARVEKIK